MKLTMDRMCDPIAAAMELEAERVRHRCIALARHGHTGRLSAPANEYAAAATIAATLGSRSAFDAGRAIGILADLRAVSAVYLCDGAQAWIDLELPLARYPVVPPGTPFLHALAGVIHLWRGLPPGTDDVPSHSTVIVGRTGGKPMAWITAPAPAYGAAFAAGDPLAEPRLGRLLDIEDCRFVSAAVLKAVADAMGPAGPMPPLSQSA